MCASPTDWVRKNQGLSTFSAWLPEGHVCGSFSALPLDVFRALWEDYHGADVATRPTGAPSRGEPEITTAAGALR